MTEGDKIKHFEKRLNRYGLKWEKNEYGNYRIFLDGLVFNSLRQAKIHMKKKKDRARRRSKWKIISVPPPDFNVGSRDRVCS